MGVITIRLMSDLCSGSGESAGNAIDIDICTDSYGFPFIPGRRLLGCLRESALLLKKYGMSEMDDDSIREIFGDADGNEGRLSMGNAYLPGVDAMHQYIDELKKSEGKEYLIRQCSEDKIVKGYTTVRGQNKINENGVAEDKTLRYIRVLNQYDSFSKKPIEFICEVDTSRLNEKQLGLFKSCCKSLRHIGRGRNRGLGNVWVTYDESENKKSEVLIKDEHTSAGDQVCISYKVSFDSAITIQEYMEDGSQIKSRTMIGVFSREYLNKFKEVDEIFNKIFLDGTVKWSSLSPVIKGEESLPAPAMFMKLKNDNGRIINAFTEESLWAGKKPKSLEGFFMSMAENGVCFVGQPEIETTYHNRINGITGKDKEMKGLYIQDSLRQGMIYGGHVIIPNDEKLIEIVKELLSVENIRIGRSKKVQYGSASIFDVKVVDHNKTSFSVQEGDIIFAVLKSDLVLRDNTGIRIDNKYVRKVIADRLELDPVAPAEVENESDYHDICSYHVITGYNAMWNMQKPKIQAVRAGSVYCFVGKEKMYPSDIILGEYQQEGMGAIKIMSLDEMKKYSEIKSTVIDRKEATSNPGVIKQLEDSLLYEAVVNEISEYGFRYYNEETEKHFEYIKNNRNKRFKSMDQEPLDVNKVPIGRLRLMLQEAKDINDLWKKIESMRISDVNSEEPLGRREHSKKLVSSLYGTEDIDFNKIITDENLKNELKKNDDVMNKLKANWKEPLSTVLHILHYKKSQKNQVRGGRF